MIALSYVGDFFLIRLSKISKHHLSLLEYLNKMYSFHIPSLLVLLCTFETSIKAVLLSTCCWQFLKLGNENRTNPFLLYRPVCLFFLQYS